MIPLLGTVTTKVWLLLFVVALGVFLFAGNRIGQVSRSPLPGVPPVVPVSFELAWTQTRAICLIITWGPDAVGRLRRGLYWDFAFIPSYVLGLVLLTGLVARALAPLSSGWSLLGGVLGYGVLAAGVFDVVENIALLRVLTPQPSLVWAPLAGIASSLKFAILFSAVSYVLVGGIRRLWRL